MDTNGGSYIVFPDKSLNLGKKEVSDALGLDKKNIKLNRDPNGKKYKLSLKLTPREEKFIYHYIKTLKDEHRKDPTTAADLAGFKPARDWGRALMQNSNIKRGIAYACGFGRGTKAKKTKPPVVLVEKGDNEPKLVIEIDGHQHPLPKSRTIESSTKMVEHIKQQMSQEVAIKHTGTKIKAENDLWELAAKSIAVMKSIIEDPNADPELRYKASKDILDRLGFKPDSVKSTMTKNERSLDISKMTDHELEDMNRYGHLLTQGEAPKSDTEKVSG